MLNKHEVYEKNVQTPYSELGKENLVDQDVWGNAVMEGKKVNVYNDPTFIKNYLSDPLLDRFPDKESPVTLVDFGGAEGHVLNLVNAEFKSQGYENINPIDLDINLSNLKRRDPELAAVRSDLTSLALKDGSVDAGIMRFALPYNTKADQELILQNISQAMKVGGRLIVLQDGGYSSDRGHNYNEFFAQASAAQGSKSLAEINSSRYFASGEELVEMAKKAGFQVTEAKELPEIESYFSPKSYASRFKMDDSQLENLRQVFQTCEESGKFEFIDGRLKRSLLRFILDK